MRSFSAAVPWITVGLLLLMMHFVSGTLTSAQGVLFDLPGCSPSDGEATGLVALMMPTESETLVFFDDARYVVGDDSSMTVFGRHLSERSELVKHRTLLVMADRRVPGGELMRLAEVARQSGLDKVLFAEKRREDKAE
jgi:biopolymer transport protein ExbD